MEPVRKKAPHKTVDLATADDETLDAMANYLREAFEKRKNKTWDDNVKFNIRIVDQFTKVVREKRERAIIRSQQTPKA